MGSFLSQQFSSLHPPGCYEQKESGLTLFLRNEGILCFVVQTSILLIFPVLVIFAVCDSHSSLFWTLMTSQAVSAIFCVVRPCLPILAFSERCCLETWTDFGFFVNVTLAVKTLLKYFECFYGSSGLGILASLQPTLLFWNFNWYWGLWFSLFLVCSLS